MHLPVRKQHVVLSYIYLSTMVDHKYFAGRPVKGTVVCTPKLSRSLHTKLLCLKVTQ